MIVAGADLIDVPRTGVLNLLRTAKVVLSTGQGRAEQQKQNPKQQSQHLVYSDHDS